jgi:hypothetical protein
MQPAGAAATLSLRPSPERIVRKHQFAAPASCPFRVFNNDNTRDVVHVDKFSQTWQPTSQKAGLAFPYDSAGSRTSPIVACTDRFCQRCFFCCLWSMLGAPVSAQLAVSQIDIAPLAASSGNGGSFRCFMGYLFLVLTTSPQQVRRATYTPPWLERRQCESMS